MSVKSAPVPASGRTAGWAKVAGRIGGQDAPAYSYPHDAPGTIPLTPRYARRIERVA